MQERVSSACSPSNCFWQVPGSGAPHWSMGLQPRCPRYMLESVPTVLTQPGTPVSFRGMFIHSLFDFRCPALFSPAFTTPRYRQHRSLTRSPSSLNYPCLSRIVAHPSIPRLSRIFPRLSRVFPQSCRAFPHVAHFADRAWSLVRSSSPCDCIPLSSQSFPLSPLYI